MVAFLIEISNRFRNFSYRIMNLVKKSNYKNEQVNLLEGVAKV